MNDDPMPPRSGTRAPDFWLPQTHYQSVSLADVQGHPTVLVFYPGDWESVSREQLALYQECLPALYRFGATLIGISVDSVWSHMAFVRALRLTYPLLSDFHPKGAVSRKYGVYLEDEGRSGRALVVLDATGMVRWSRTYPINLNPGVDGILTALETMQKEEIR